MLVVSEQGTLTPGHWPGGHNHERPVKSETKINQALSRKTWMSVRASDQNTQTRTGERKQCVRYWKSQ